MARTRPRWWRPPPAAGPLKESKQVGDRERAARADVMVSEQQVEHRVQAEHQRDEHRAARRPQHEQEQAAGGSARRSPPTPASPRQHEGVQQRERGDPDGPVRPQHHHQENPFRLAARPQCQRRRWRREAARPRGRHRGSAPTPKRLLAWPSRHRQRQRDGGQRDGLRARPMARPARSAPATRARGNIGRRRPRGSRARRTSERAKPTIPTRRSTDEGW